MESVSTKETSGALTALTKHKSRSNKPVNVAVQPVAVMVNSPKIEVAATPNQNPANPPATSDTTPEPKLVNTQNGRDHEKAWKELKTKYDTEMYNARQTEKQLREELANTLTPQVVLPKTKEEIEAYRKQYPEAMDVFTTIALETTGALSNKLREDIAEINKFKTELKEKEAFKSLLELHPDAMEIRSSLKFKEWYDAQSPAIQNILANSNDLNAVSEMLDLYKLKVLGVNSKEQKAAKAKDAIDSSLGVDVRGKTEITSQKKIWTASEINAICADYKTYLKYRVEIDDARREGRVDETK